MDLSLIATHFSDVTWIFFALAYCVGTGDQGQRDYID
jgi:hypothetical protein